MSFKHNFSNLVLVAVAVSVVSVAAPQRANALACATGFFPGRVCNDMIRTPVFWVVALLTAGSSLIMYLDEENPTQSIQESLLQQNPTMRKAEALNLAAVIYNSGVKLQSGDTGASVSLKQLEEAAPHFAQTAEFQKIANTMISQANGPQAK